MSASQNHVFVSHSSDNRELANELAAFLESRGVRVWIAPRDVRPGMDYSEELQRAIEGCVAFVVLVTEMANKSPYVRAETEMAFSSHKPIFPVRTSDIQPAAGLAFFLKIRHWTDAFGPGKDDSLERLVRELQAFSAAAATPAAQVPPTAQPVAPPAFARPPEAAPLSVSPVADDPELVAAAVGPKADWYRQRWAEMDAKNKSVSWNWPACLFNLFWFGWRKMWVPMAAVLAATLALGVIGAGSPALGQVTFLVTIGISFVTGSFGNHLYRRQTRRLVEETGHLPRAQRIDALKARGGVSTPALVVLLAIVGVLTLIATLGAIASQRAPAPDDGGGQQPQNEVVPPGFGDPDVISGEVQVSDKPDE